MILALSFVAGLFTIYLSSCNQSKIGQPLSPTSATTSSDSSGVPFAKGKGVSKKDLVSSNVKPALPPPGSCLGYQEESQYVASVYQFNGVYLPEDVYKGKYLVIWGGAPNNDYPSLYSKYCFRRAICGTDGISTFTSAGFKQNELLITINSQNYQSIVSQYRNTVLGYYIDEPSGNITGATMATVKNCVASYGAKLWLDDYDTGPFDKVLYAPVHNYHLADVPCLDNGDYVWNDGNTSKWVSGANILGISCLQDDYNEFQYWFGNNFNGIFCKPMDGSGALMNDATMYNWLSSHPNCNNFAILLSSDFTNAWPAALNNFINDADRAGFLGHQYQVYSYTYTCQISCVNFTPPSSPDYGAGASIYWGVWTNSAYYRGPVDASTPGATICWILQSTAATSQTVNVY